MLVHIFIDRENRTTFCANVTDKNAVSTLIRSFSAINGEHERKGVIFNLNRRLAIAALRPMG